jgi:hypothetical protein
VPEVPRTDKRSFALITFVGLLFAATAHARSFEGSFRGTLVCGQLKTAGNTAALKQGPAIGIDYATLAISSTRGSNRLGG